MFEALFKAVIEEKAKALKKPKASMLKQIEDRIQLIALTLRQTIEISVNILRYKTVKAIVHHIVQTLPVGGGAFYEPLALDYIRSLKLLLSYPPHAEHLNRDDWSELTRFCCLGLESQLGLTQENDEGSILVSSSKSFSMSQTNS